MRGDLHALQVAGGYVNADVKPDSLVNSVINAFS